MFIVTARVPKKKLLAGGVALLCCCVVAATAVILSAGGVAVAASAEVRGIRDNDDRVAYLNELGWTVSQTTSTIPIPTIWRSKRGKVLTFPGIAASG